MRIATWNINGLRARLDFIRIWLETREPDIVGFQELKLAEHEFPTETFAELGYHVAFHSQKAWNGVAVISREPIDSVSRGLPGRDEQGARFINALIGDLSFTTVYVPNGKDVDHADFPEKLAWLDALAEHMKTALSSTETAVLCGDFNIVPAALDSWRGEKGDGRIFHTADERRRFQSLIETGLVDLFREKYPDTQQFSWWDYRAGAFHRGHGLRIDFMLGTAPVLDRTADVWIDRDFRKKQDGLTASDHAPVIVELD